MNPHSQTFPGENPAADRNRLLALSVAAVVLVDLGLALLLLEDKGPIAKVLSVAVEKGSAPSPVTGPGHQGGR